MTDPLLFAQAALDMAENRVALAELNWSYKRDSLEEYAAFQAALAGWKKAAELYWDARREDRKR